jgi:protein arginine N-methyltransferase 1
MTTDEIEYILEMWPLSDNTNDHLSSHHLLLRDRVRNEAFRRAIRRVVRPGDVVLDVGAGTGILSAFALEAGARHVYLVEAVDILSCAQKILRRSGWSRRVTLIRGKAENISYKGGKVDAILIELIGSFGVDENILDVLPPVRNQVLRDGGSIIPQRLRLLVAPVAHASFERELRLYRSVRYGVDLSPLAALADNNVYLINLRTADLLAEPQQLMEFDLLTCRQSRFDRHVHFTIHRRGRLIGFAGWFEVDLCEGMELSNSPKTNQTHWDQVLFPVGESVSVRSGDSVSFRLRYGTPSGVDEWTWSGALRTRQAQRRFRFSSEKRFPLVRVPSHTTLRID